MKKLKYHPMVRILSILFGTFLMSLSINALLIPHQILSGGVTGIAVLFHLLFGLNTYTAVLVLNIPLFILAYFYLNRRFVFLSLLGMFSLTFFIFLTEGVTIPTNDLLVVVILGGIISGFGAGIILKFNGSAGGSDILAKMIYKYRGYNISNVLFAINFIVVFLSVSFFGTDLAIYTLISMFISSNVSRLVIDGVHNKRAVFIITNEPDLIATAIMHQLHRGVTTINVTGSFTKTQKQMLYCTIGIREVAQLKLIVKDIDPKAFMTITDTSQVFGNGFIDIKSED